MFKPDRKLFAVGIDIPKGVTLTEMRDYIRDAVASWKGQLEPPRAYGDNTPRDPLFQLDGDSVTVSYEGLFNKKGS